MPVVNVHQEILDWSTDRYPWQQDALRRLVTQDEVNEADIHALASLCKAKHGLEDRKESKPLKKRHLPNSAAAGSAVQLEHLTHHVGVNALAPGQTLHFGPNLTIVYGENGAGKSGYTRILKRACRARGAEQILGNVTAGAPAPPSALIRYSVGGELTDFAWSDQSGVDRQLSRVSVFDRQCASVYIAKRTDVAFRPLGLDLFDKLSTVCEEVRKVLEKERRDLERQELELPTVPPDTVVASLLANLNAQDADEVRRLSSWSEKDTSRVAEIQRRIQDIAVHDPQAVAKTLLLRIDRLSNFRNRLEDVSAALSESSVQSLLQARDTYRTAVRTLEQRTDTFKSMPVDGVGSTLWTRLWDAARDFFTTEAYPGRPYPSRDAHCVLCQRPHSDESFERMQKLNRHASSAIQVNHEEAAKKYRSARDSIEGAIVGELDAITEIAIDDERLSAHFDSICECLKGRRDSILAALHRDGSMDAPAPFDNVDCSSLQEHINHLRTRADAITAPDASADLEAMKNELRELESRRALHESVDVVLAEIRRNKKIAIYQQCVDETHTATITRKSTELTKKAVTNRLIQAFTDELNRLKFRHVDVDLVEAGGERGKFYHKLTLKRAPGEKLANIVSEGEARCLSIASFFAELSTADDQSAILFDDPVSSLDETWRHSVAKRLAEESVSRQVVVFTHDLVFLHALRDTAYGLNVNVGSCHLRRTHLWAGLTTKSLPTPALKVNKRIGHLKDQLQGARSLFKKGEQDEYERRGREIYGALREAWERGVEEVLLDGIVERFRPSVQTRNKIMFLSDIRQEDCAAVQTAMSKCSTFFLGHDKSPADAQPFPKPEEVESDIDFFHSWVQTIRSRRK